MTPALHVLPGGGRHLAVVPTARNDRNALVLASVASAMNPGRVKTEEIVEGTYKVEADSEVAAQAKFQRSSIDGEGVEQIDYMAYSIDLASWSLYIEDPASSPSTDRDTERQHG